MRIISGKFKGRKINTVSSKIVRPTLDRVREAIFSSIQFDIKNRRVCDLFAGSGAMGIEALSRGASYCTFVEKNSKVFRMISANIEALEILDENYELLNMDAAAFLKKYPGEHDMFFIDPPYGKGLVEPIIERILTGEHLSSEGVLIVEYGASEKLDLGEFKTLDIYKQKLYGDTAICILKRMD